MNSRDDWVTVVVPRTNLYMFFEKNVNVFGNNLHYAELQLECERLFPKDEWESFVDPSTGEKHFRFAHEKYATLFRLIQI